MKPMILADKTTDKARKVLSTVGAVVAATIARAEVAWAGGFTYDKIDINPEGLDSKELLSRVAGILVTICVIVGAFKVISGTIAYLQARDDGNGPAESKALWSIGIGLTFVGASAMFKFLFGG